MCTCGSIREVCNSKCDWPSYRATKLRQGNVFIPVCDSVHRGGLCPGRVSVQGGLCPGGVSVWGVSLSGGCLSGRPPVRLRAGGTYPTGMHSCYDNNINS